MACPDVSDTCGTVERNFDTTDQCDIQYDLWYRCRKSEFCDGGSWYCGEALDPASRCVYESDCEENGQECGYLGCSTTEGE